MGYPKTLKVVSRKLTSNIVIASCGFTRVNTLNFGARMALFNYDNDIVINNGEIKDYRYNTYNVKELKKRYGG